MGGLEKESEMSEKADIEAAVDNFAAAMKKRMLSKAKQGWRGWDTCYPNIPSRLQRNAASAALHGDQKSCVDVANFAMMIWLIKEK